jgi:type II secretion system protein J
LNRNHAQPGFTLIELLAAIAITAIIAGAGATILRLIGGARERLDAQVAVDQEASAAMSAITDALGNVYRSRIAGDLLLEGVDDFDGGLPRDSIRFFMVSTRQIRKGEPESDLRQVEFFLAQPDLDEFPTLMRRTDPTRNDEPDRGGVVERVAARVIGLNFSYLDSRHWRDDWPESLHAWPRVIKVEVVTATGGVRPAFTTASRLVSFPRLARSDAAPAGVGGEARAPGNAAGQGGQR